ncbi:MAG: LppX_LprAFG lipoprotein [Chloroflexi bacterium]|nr:LppX_LprAFG lipoprotein [Chloroflexota bacterium]
MSKNISLGRTMTFSALCFVSVLLLTGCSLPWKHSASAGLNGTTPTAQQLLASLQKNFADVSAFHVVMQVQNPGPAAQGQVQIRNANGDVIMPDKVKAQATVILSGQSVMVNLISVGGNQYITDPITGQWRVIKGVLDPRTLTNPNTGIVSLLGKVQHITQPASDTVNNTPCWRVTGQLDAKYIAFLSGGGVPAGTMLQTSACIGKDDSLPYQVSVTGRAAPGDTAQTSRTFIMSKYNESIQISAPQV